ncbi:MAG: hypothetical protein BJ554DRAFT_795 [Olpidium bornovanus]|uniref:Uncharacterized protein n=1 Tax=Olpidium bornovanus TaxID=278681 RepID=A0A8H7ZTT4_9FUNG|nr:MAG: hypothetical protein BJ554DRAFT_795 [Olpidium bornovanus]
MRRGEQQKKRTLVVDLPKNFAHLARGVEQALQRVLQDHRRTDRAPYALDGFHDRVDDVRRRLKNVREDVCAGKKKKAFYVLRLTRCRCFCQNAPYAEKYRRDRTLTVEQVDHGILAPEADDSQGHICETGK